MQEKNTLHKIWIQLYSLSVHGEMNCVVREQPETWGQISFPKPPKSFMLVDEEETLPETSLTVKRAHLAFDFHHLQRRRDAFTEKPGEANAHEALRAGEPVVLLHWGHSWAEPPVSGSVFSPSDRKGLVCFFVCLFVYTGWTSKYSGRGSVPLRCCPAVLCDSSRHKEQSWWRWAEGTSLKHWRARALSETPTVLKHYITLLAGIVLWPDVSPDLDP